MMAAIYFISALVVFSGSVLAADGAAHADWTSYGGTHSAWRYSSLDRINRENIHKLSPVWVFQTGDYQNGLQARPIAIDGVLYISTSSNNAIAADGHPAVLHAVERYSF